MLYRIGTFTTKHLSIKIVFPGLVNFFLSDKRQFSFRQEAIRADRCEDTKQKLSEAFITKLTDINGTSSFLA